jgi:ribosome biogenesis GTPase
MLTDAHRSDLCASVSICVHLWFAAGCRRRSGSARDLLAVPTDESLEGLVVRAQSGFFTVDTPAGPLVCQVRGRLQKQRLDTDILAVGDRVHVRPLRPGVGQIEDVLPRTRVLSRRDPQPGRREREQILVANPDQAVFVFACTQPDPHSGLLDRFLVTAEAQRLPARICVNKVDLVTPERARELFGLYEEIGYPVLYTSALTGAGIPELRATLAGRLSVLAGPSGAGKSSLLNALQPGLGLRAREISRATSKGRHTTVVPELLPLDGGGYVADTPGLRALALWDIQPEEIDAYFPDIRPYVADCEFSDCSHTHEPGCAVRAALEAGRIHPARFNSYQRMREDPGSAPLF